jgi:hypothetical protein
MRPSDKYTSHSRNGAWYVCALLILLAGLIPHVLEPLKGNLIDYETYVGAKKVYINGGNPYAQPYMVKTLVKDELHPNPYLYPPPFLDFFSMLTPFDDYTNKLIWVGASYLALCIALFLWAQIFIRSGVAWGRGKVFALIAFLGVSFEAAFAGALEGQVHTFLLLLLTLVIYSTSLKQNLIAGLFILAGTFLKVSPVILLGAAAIRKQFRVILFCIIGLALLLGAHLAIGNTSLWIAFFKQIGGQYDGFYDGNKFQGNFAPEQAIFLILDNGADSLIRAGIRIVLVILLCLISFLCYRRKTSSAACYGIFVCFMVFFTPVVWHHHFALYLIPIFIILEHALRQPGDKRIKTIVNTGICYFLFSKLALFAHMAAAMGGAEVLAVAIVLPVFASAYLVSELMKIVELPSDDSINHSTP